MERDWAGLSFPLRVSGAFALTAGLGPGAPRLQGGARVEAGGAETFQLGHRPPCSPGCGFSFFHLKFQGSCSNDNDSLGLA